VAGRASVPIDDPVPALPSLIRELVDRMPDLDAQRVEIELNSAPRLSSFKLLDPSRAQPWRRRLFRWRSPATHRRRRRRPRVLVGRQAFTPSRPARSRKPATRPVAWCGSSTPLRSPRGRAVLRVGAQDRAFSEFRSDGWSLGGPEDCPDLWKRAIAMVEVQAGVKKALTSSAHRSRVIPGTGGGHDVVETAGAAAGLS
jgi:hypothetical protein